MRRLPSNYVGIGHETLGSDLLALLKTVTLPERTLGDALYQRLAGVRPEGWYPVSLLLDALDVLELKLGAFGLRHVGWELFKLAHAEQFRQHVHSVHQLAYGFDALYRRINRGEAIGGWSVLTFEPGLAILEKTTPHHCVMEEGILEEAMRTLGIRVEVSQQQCLRQGADACHFVLRSPITDERWTG